MADFNPAQFNSIPPQFRLADSYESPLAPAVAATEETGIPTGFAAVPSKKESEQSKPTKISVLFTYDQFNSRLYSDTIGLRVSSNTKTSPGSIVGVGAYGHGWLSVDNNYVPEHENWTLGDPVPLGLSGGIDVRLGDTIQGTKISPSVGLNVGLDPFRVVAGLAVFAVTSWEVGADLALQVGPLELRGGVYPNGRSVMYNIGNYYPGLSDIEVNDPTLSALNPGIRIGGNFLDKKSR